MTTKRKKEIGHGGGEILWIFLFFQKINSYKNYFSGPRMQLTEGALESHGLICSLGSRHNMFTNVYTENHT